MRRLACFIGLGVLLGGIAFAASPESGMKSLGTVLVPVGGLSRGTIAVNFLQLKPEYVKANMKAKGVVVDTFASKFSFLPDAETGGLDPALLKPQAVSRLPITVTLPTPNGEKSFSELENGVWIGIPLGKSGEGFKWEKATYVSDKGDAQIVIDKSAGLDATITIEGTNLRFEFKSWPIGDPCAWGG